MPVPMLIIKCQRFSFIELTHSIQKHSHAVLHGNQRYVPKPFIEIIFFSTFNLVKFLFPVNQSWIENFSKRITFVVVEMMDCVCVFDTRNVFKLIHL